MLESFLWTPSKRGCSVESVNNVVFCSLFLWTLCCYFQNDKAILFRDLWYCMRAMQLKTIYSWWWVKVQGYITSLTSEKTRVIDWSWIDILVTHLVFIPTVKSHIFLPLFKPVTVHQVPKETASSIISALTKQDRTLLISLHFSHVKWWDWNIRLLTLL